MDIRNRINEKLKVSMREKDQVSLSTVRLIIAALKDRDIAARGKGEADGISEAEILSMLQGMIKQRQESAETYEKAGRSELSERELAEVKVIEEFLPKQMSDEALHKAIDELVVSLGIKEMRQMGALMAELKSKYAGQIDMSKASAIIKAKLS